MAGQEGLFIHETGSGPPLLLLHGLMTTGEMFDELAKRLAPRFRVLMPDLRGHGRSRHLPPPDSMQQMAADLPPILAARGVEAATVLGYSLGGLVAQQLALDFPQLVQRLILMATFASNNEAAIDKIEARLMPVGFRMLGPVAIAHLLMAVPGIGGGPRMPVSITDEVRAMLAASDREQMVAVTRAMESFDSMERLGEISVPTLVIAGADDWAAPVRQAEVLVQQIPGAELQILPNAGHTLVWTHTEALAALVAAWLGAPLVGSGDPNATTDSPA